MGESFNITNAAGAVDKLVRAVGGKFNGTGFDLWCRTAKSVMGMRHTGISDILDGRPCPEPIFAQPPRGRSTTRRTSPIGTRHQVSLAADADESAQRTASTGDIPSAAQDASGGTGAGASSLAEVGAEQDTSSLRYGLQQNSSTAASSV